MLEIKRGDVWYIESGYSTGSEQRPGRPAVVVSNDKCNKYSSCVEVVYLTTQPKKDLPTHAAVNSVGRGSTAICEQITSVAVERFGTYKGSISDEEMAAIDAAMLISLGLTGLAEIESEMLKGEDTHTPEQDDSELSTRLFEAETRYAMLQQMYDSLLNRVITRDT